MKLAVTLLLAAAPLWAEPVPFLEKLSGPGDFEKVASPSFIASALDLPSVMLVLDRDSGRTYYVNGAVYPLHLDFINKQYLSMEKGKRFEENNLDIEERRFLMAFLVKRGGCYSLELWQDDIVSPGMLENLYGAVKKSFPSAGCVKFYPLSEGQAALSGRTSVPFLRTDPPAADDRYQVISEGISYGKVLVTGALPRKPEAGAIYVLEKPPQNLLMGMSGFVTGEVSSKLSHACILARTLELPAFFIPGAAEYFKRYEGSHVRFEVRRGTFSVTPASAEETGAYLERRRAKKRKELFADFDWKDLTELSGQTSADISRFGAKSANLGQVAGMGVEGFTVPPGFTVPFYYYGRFIRENGLAGEIESVLSDPEVYTDSETRSRRLAALRKKIEGGSLWPEFSKALASRAAKTFGGKGVFVRSTTNSEDLPNFSGAGLYTTVPNVKGEKALLAAVKKVWASIWNDRAFEARELFGIDHRSAMPAVLIQEAMSADAAGVMFTRSDLPGPYAGCLEIGAKRGLGIRVVEGHSEPERIYYCGGRLHMGGLSKDDRMIVFSPGGGVTERRIRPGERALEDDIALRLARAGQAIEKGFGGVPQDVEWLVIGKDIYIVQSRPYSFSPGGGR